MNEQDRFRMEVNTEHQMKQLLKKAHLIADFQGKGEISMMKLREWVLLKGNYPEHTYERTILEVDLENEGIDKLLKDKWE